MTTQQFLNSLLRNCLEWNKSTHCSVHLYRLFLILYVQCNQQFKNKKFCKLFKIFKDCFLLLKLLCKI